MKPQSLDSLFSTWRLYAFMLVDLCLWAFRLLADLFLDTIGLLHLPQRGRIPPVTDPLLMQPATVLTERIRKGEVKSETLVSAYIDRIKVVNPLVNAMVSDCFEEALAEARALDVRIQAALASPATADQSVLSLPLLGIPFSIKECISVRGQPCSAGLYSRRHIRMEEDAPAVKSLRDAGAIILGVTNVPEFLLWWDTNNRLYGRTNNPYDLSRISGGSSGGEAALMSAGGSLVGMGSDIGGSIRIPSFFNGVFGHKPSSDIVPCTGNYPYCGHPEREKFLVLGPIVRYPVDLKLIMRTIVHPHLLPTLRFDEPVDLRRSKFHFLTSDGDPMKTPVCPDVVEGIERARQCLRDHGCATFDADLPLLRHSFYMWLTALSDMDSPKLAAEVMERKGELNGWLELLKSMTVGSHFRKITCLNVILENAVYSQSTRQWPVFRRVVERCQTLKRQLESLLDDDAILILPTLPEKAPKHNGTFLRMNNCGYTAIFNIMELPVTQVTLGLGRRTGMPVGFQVVGRRLNDRLTIATAELLAKRFDGWTPPFKVNL